MAHVVLDDGMAWTATTVVVTESLRGSLKAGDQITVLQLGGYVPLATEIATGKIDRSRIDPTMTAAQISKRVNKYVVDGEPFPAVGEDCVYFLTEVTTGDVGFPAGGFFRVRGQESKFKASSRALTSEDPSITFTRRMDKNGAGRTVPNSERTLTVGSLKKMIARWPHEGKESLG